jgi:superfamily II DNA/RNA helicase
VRLNQVEVLVLDEADRMLDMGFIHDIRAIVAKLPKERQTLLFSATMPREISDLATQMLRDPVRVAVTPVASTVERVAQRVIMVDKPAKSALLVETLRAECIGQTLVFTRTKHGADKVVKQLHHAGLSAEAIHGNKSQNQRERVLGSFRAGKLKTLVATDIAARGIDVDGISHVINFDLPNIPESYVHRIGRTARAGAEGIAISFCDNEEMPFLRDIEKLIQLKLPVTERRTSPRTEAAPRHRPQNANGRNGNRRNGQPQRRNGGGNGHGQQPRRNEHGHQAQQPRRNEPGRQGQQPRRHENRAPAAASSPDSIATVAFMRQPEPRRAPGDAGRHTR